MTQTVKYLGMLVITVMVTVALSLLLSPSMGKAVVGYVVLQPALNGTTSTTTRSYMTPGAATSTYEFSYESAVNSTIFLQLTASTSATYLGWKWYFSNDGIDWHAEDSYATTALVTGNTLIHASSSPENLWSPGSTVASTSMTTIAVPDVMTRRVRLQIYIPAGKSSSNGAIWLRALQKGN